MKDYEFSYDVLLKVVRDEVPFNMAIHSVLNKPNKTIIDPNLKSTLYALCGCVLRHYYIFKELITREYGELPIESLLCIALGMGNNLFAKRINKEKLDKFIVKNTGLIGAPAFISCFQDPKKLIPEDIKYSSNEYYSLRYNIPLWVVEMWINTSGEILAKKIFHSFSNREQNLVRINESIISKDHFFKKYKDFSSFEGGLAKYNGDSSLKKHRAIVEGDALRIASSYEYMCRNIKLDDVAFYSCGTSHLLEELCARKGPTFPLTLICGHQGHLLELKDVINKYGLIDVELLEGDYSKIDKLLENDVETFFVCPRSSFLLGLLERADHFLRVKPENLNGIVETEYNSLCAASERVKQGGNLVYFVTTFYKNECHKLIHHFLKEHDNYELVEEKNFLPFDQYQTMFYFANLKRK